MKEDLLLITQEGVCQTFSASLATHQKPLLNQDVQNAMLLLF